MAARFPQSGTSVAYRIANAYSSKIKALYWAASADSVHRLYSSDTSTTILTRATSGAGFNATDGLITGDVNGSGGVYFSDSVSGGFGVTEAGPFVYGYGFFGDLFNGASADFWVMGAVAPMDAFRNKAAIYVAGSGDNMPVSGQSPSTSLGGLSDDVAAWETRAFRYDSGDGVATSRGWRNGAEVTGFRTSPTASASNTIGDASNALRFGGSESGTGNTNLHPDCWWVASGLTDAELNAITADPSVMIEVSGGAVGGLAGGKLNNGILFGRLK